MHQISMRWSQDWRFSLALVRADMSAQQRYMYGIPNNLSSPFIPQDWLSVINESSVGFSFKIHKPQRRNTGQVFLSNFYFHQEFRHLFEKDIHKWEEKDNTNHQSWPMPCVNLVVERRNMKFHKASTCFFCRVIACLPRTKSSSKCPHNIIPVIIPLSSIMWN